MIISQLFSNPMDFIMWVVAFVMVISIHEYAHALAAYLQGDRTAQGEGRLTINPLRHLDLMGTLMILFVGFGWGRPVPFNPYNLKNQRFGPAIVSFAGPFSNFILLIMAIITYRITFNIYGPYSLGSQFWLILANLSVGLALFNLIPVPPLDGSKILNAVLPDRFFEFKNKLEYFGPYLLLFLIVFDNIGGVSLFGWLSDLSRTIVDFGLGLVMR